MDRFGERTDGILFDRTPAERDESSYTRWYRRNVRLKQLRGDYPAPPRDELLEAV